MKKVLQNLRNELLKLPDTKNDIKLIKSQLENIPDNISISEELLLAQKADRIIRLSLSGIENELYHQLIDIKDPLWSDAPEINIEVDQAHNIAKQFYISHIEGGEGKSMLKIGHIGKDIAEALMNIFKEKGKEIEFIEFDEPYFNALLFAESTKEGFDAIKHRRLQKYQNSKKLINIRQNLPKDIADQYSPEIMNMLNEYITTGSYLLGNGELFYTLTILPTLDDATIDNMDYNEYTDLFLESCDQPWDIIRDAHNILIDRLDNADSLHIYNEDGTDVTMSIKGMTFANSLVLKNIPGSEIFSAPVRESVNGRIVAKGRFQYEHSPIIENIRLEIKNGQIIDCGAEKNGSEFKKIIQTNDGADFFGEIGIGTNPHLQQHLVNGLLVEKVSGSFHMAIGGAYSYTHYNGTPVHLNNGNISEVHWDITTMLRGKKSYIKIDDEIVQQDGMRLDPALKILNEGRGVVDKSIQPNRWKNKYPNGYGNTL